ncbi:MAG: alpha-galactosidase [Planctomycetia bacterium]|nr:alpha-galactosidase [Planctomycetia bacterium]
MRLLTLVLAWYILVPLISYGEEVGLLYDGNPVDIRSDSIRNTDTGVRVTQVTPDGKLEIRIDTKHYEEFPVRERRVRLTCLSTEPTGIVSDFDACHTWGRIPLPEENGVVTLHTLAGSLCNPDDFAAAQTVLKPSEEKTFFTETGRPSNETLPFLEYSLNERKGGLVAIGWTGSWKATFVNDGKNLTLNAGMNRMHFRLLPGESVVLPSIVLFDRDDMSRREFRTLVHRFMIEHKSPRDARGNVIPPILALTAGGGNKTPEMMKSILQYGMDQQLPFDTYWVDAGWYGAPHEDEHYSNCGPHWARYVGDWRINTTTHPTGSLRPITDAVHKAGMKFLLWFEPERMEDGAPILETHPEFRNRNLVDYGNPEALRWIQDTVYGIIENNGVDIYRQDFNMDPQGVWNELDAADPDRVGVAQAKHVTGLYRFLDEMRAEFPGMLQENCASGGRRIDIEMVSRAHSYCRSDYYIGQKPGDTAINLGQTATLNTLPFLPFQGGETNCAPTFDDYAMMSTISSGTVFTPTDFDGGIVRRTFTDEESAWFRKCFTIANRMRPYYMGDFHPLTEEVTASNALWCGWQLHREDLDTGFALVFRRSEAPEETRSFDLGGIDPEATYETEDFHGVKNVVSGEDLVRWSVSLEPRSFRLMFYRKLATEPNP